MNSGQQLVVVDGVPETTQVLRAVFEPRGYDVNRVRAFELPQFPRDRQSILVVHGEGDDGNGTAGTPSETSVPRVIIGSIAANSGDGASGDHRLQQPFQYAELIRAVEALLVD